jgi:hypothetical protein
MLNMTTVTPYPACKEILDKGEMQLSFATVGLVSSILCTSIFVAVGYQMKFTHIGAIMAAIMAIVGLIIFAVYRSVGLQGPSIFNECQEIEDSIKRQN